MVEKGYLARLYHRGYREIVKKELLHTQQLLASNVYAFSLKYFSKVSTMT